MKLNIKVQILPIGTINSKILRKLVNQLENFFPNLELLETVPLLETAYDKKRDQYLSDEFLREVKWHAAVNGENHILGITDADLYTPGLNFVFGQAELPGKAAIISISRLNHNDNDLFHTRMLKEAIHELGHTVGLRHCPDIHCVMHFSNSLKDTDIKGESFCERCKSKLKKNI